MVSPSVPPKRVAIVGSGVSGLGALYALRNTPHEVHLFESADRLGGHTNTVTFKHEDREVQVDTGFIVMNSATYPNFLQFLADLSVPVVDTEMTFGVSRDAGAFEWAGTSLSAVFAQRRNIFNVRVWRMLFDVVRFNQFALDLLHTEDESEEDPNTPGAGESEKKKPSPQREQESIGDYLTREGYSAAFRDDYLIPMTAAVWSTSPDKCSLDFPAVTLVRFMWNHHLLTTVAARPAWMTIKGGSQQYIDALLKDFPKDRIHLSTPITAVTSLEDEDGKVQVRVRTSTGRRKEEGETFDHIILACHGDTATDIIRAGNALEEELEIMSGFKTSENVAYLHSDLSLMPRRRLAWSAWNYLTTTSPTTTSTSTSTNPISSVCLTYDMNTLQHIPRAHFPAVLVTLNPLHPPSPSTVQGTYKYHHPLYTAAAIRSQKSLARMQGTRGISYAGAWTKYGFHEDGFSSGVKVACCEALGGAVGWEFVDSTFSRGRRPVLGWLDWVVRALVVGVGWWIVAVNAVAGAVFGEDEGKRKVA